MANTCCENEFFNYETISQKVSYLGHARVKLPFWSLCSTGNPENRKKEYTLCTREEAYMIDIGNGSLNYISYNSTGTYIYFYTFMRSQAFNGAYLPVGDHYTIGKRNNGTTDLHRTFYHMKSLKPCYTFYEVFNNSTVNDILSVCTNGRCKDFAQQSCAYFEQFVCNIYGSSACGHQIGGNTNSKNASIIESARKKTTFQKFVEKHLVPTFDNAIFNVLFVSAEERIGFLHIIDERRNEFMNTQNANASVKEDVNGKITYIYPVELIGDKMRFVTLDYVFSYLENTTLPIIPPLNECQISALFSNKDVCLAFATILMSSTQYEEALMCIRSSTANTLYPTSCYFNEASKLMSTTTGEGRFCQRSDIIAYGGKKTIKPKKGKKTQ